MATTAIQIAELARRVGGTLRGRGDLAVTGVNAIDEATEQDITFVADAAHARRWGSTRARSALVGRDLEPAGFDPARQALIEVEDPELSVIEVLKLFAPPAALPPPGVHPMAWVAPTARLGRDVRVAAHASVDERAVIGDRTLIHAGVRIYPDAVIGDDCVIHANAVIRERCVIGRRVLLHQGAMIGADGFGFRPAPGGGGLIKVPQIGTVEIGDDVEIGAGTCVDRAKFGATVVGPGTKIDNLCQIGHNCRIGRSCVIAGLSGLGGSVVVGDFVRIGGAVGIADHLTIGDGATIGARAGVTRDVPPGKSYVGYPAREWVAFFREMAALKRLPELLRQGSRGDRLNIG